MSSKGPHYRVSSWSPKEVADFLEVHGFRMQGLLDGDDSFWIGKGEDGKDAQAAFPTQRKELASGTMRDSVMRQSGYGKRHWDLWRSLKKNERRKALCCDKIKEHNQ